jgi:small subunit ribosomal protein S9
MSKTARTISPAIDVGRPVHPAYFTGNPYYFDTLLKVNGYIQRIRDFQAKNKSSTEEKLDHVKWMESREMLEKYAIKTSQKELLELHEKFDFLHSQKSNFLEEEENEITTFLQKFVRKGSLFKRPIIEYPKLDEYQRSITLGSRKTAKAKVYMIPGEGKVMVNGIHFSDYFNNELELNLTVKPLDVLDAWGKYNIWAIASGGGKTSQANAIGLGIARGLIIQDPTLETVLTEAGLLTPDTRQVERKKTGQPKARKKITWVKR